MFYRIGSKIRGRNWFVSGVVSLLLSLLGAACAGSPPIPPAQAPLPTQAPARATALPSAATTVPQPAPTLPAATLPAATLAATALPAVPVDVPGVGRVVATIPLIGQAGGLGFGDGSLWIGTEAGILLRVDTATNKIIANLPIKVSGLHVSGDAVWVSEDGSRKLVKIDAKTNTVVEEIETGSDNLGPLAVDGNFIWDGVIAGGKQSVMKVDMLTKKVLAQSDNLGNFWDVTVGAGAVWATDEDTDAVLRLDSQTAKTVARIEVGLSPTGIAFGEGSVWTANRDGTVSRIDPATDKEIARITVGGTLMFLAVADGVVWAAGRDVGCDQSGSPSGEVARIDPKSNTVVGVMVMPCALTLTIAPGAVWAVDNVHQATRNGLLWRIAPA